MFSSRPDESDDRVRSLLGKGKSLAPFSSLSFCFSPTEPQIILSIYVLEAPLNGPCVSLAFWFFSLSYACLPLLDSDPQGFASFTCPAFSLLLGMVDSAQLLQSHVHLHDLKEFANRISQCWIPQIHAKERLALHYFWIFLAEFVTLALYIYLFVFLYRRTRNLARNMRRTTLSSPTAGDVISQLYKAARYMLLYPLVYIVLTLPLSIGRMLNMQGYEPPLVFWTVMGSLMTSAGWVDAIVYSITRGVLVTKDPANLGRTESAQSLAQYGAAAGSTAAPGAQGAGRHVDDDDDALSRYGGALGSPKPRDSFMTSGGKEIGGELASKTSVVSAPSPPPQTKSTLQ